MSLMVQKSSPIQILRGVAVTIRNIEKQYGAIQIFTSFDELNLIVHKVIEVQGEKLYLDSQVSSRGLYRTTDCFFEDFPYAKKRLGKGTGNMIASNFFDCLPEVYKGIMALVYRESCRDFVKGTTMDIVKSMDEAPDIHHIFPEAYCIRQGYPRKKWNSIVNKTPLLPESNRQIGGEAPSKYSRKILKKADIDEVQYRIRVESHLVDYEAFIHDDFDTYFVERAKAIMLVIENAMGKSIADKGSEQTIRLYGVSLE